jgi:uncharacterized protein YbjT (DUF2867 family)
MNRHKRKVNMKILVTTPTGDIGRIVVEELLAPEFSVRVIVRDPARLPEEIHRHVEVMRGSADDTATLRRALTGVDALFWCVPPESIHETNVRGHYERFARAAGKAVREAQTPRVVTISAGGNGSTHNAGAISGLRAMENILDQSGAAIRHLRCGMLMENLLAQAESIAEHGVISYPMPGHIPIPMVAATDVADMALRWLVRCDWNGIESATVHGPEDISFGQVAAVIERILERPVRYQEASPNHYAQALIERGASTEYARNQIDMFAALANGVLRAEPRTAEMTTPTTLSAWAASELRPLLKQATTPMVDIV